MNILNKLMLQAYEVTVRYSINNERRKKLETLIDRGTIPGGKIRLMYYRKYIHNTNHCKQIEHISA